MDFEDCKSRVPARKLSRLCQCCAFSCFGLKFYQPNRFEWPCGFSPSSSSVIGISVLVIPSITILITWTSSSEMDGLVKWVIVAIDYGRFHTI